MSVEAITWGYQQECRTPVEKFVLVTVCNEADKSGVTFAGQARIAGACGATARTVSEHLGALEGRGVLARVRRHRPNGSRTSDYIILAPGPVDRGAMIPASSEEVPDAVFRLTADLHEDSSHEGGGGTRPVSSSKTTRTTARQETLDGSGSSAPGKKSARRSVTYRGAKVPEALVRVAEELLADFNAAFERKLSPWTEDGKPQPVLRQIIGALRARPDVEPGDWKRAIGNTAANPPGWAADRQMQIGDVFGEKAADHALANTGQPPNGRRSRSQDRHAGTLERIRQLRAGEHGD